MKSVQIDKFGEPEVLVVKDVELGKPGPKEVLIKISFGPGFAISTFLITRTSGPPNLSI